MARRSNDEVLYSTFKLFLESCIINNKSLLWPDMEAWSKERVLKVKERMVDNPIWGDNLSFEEKLVKQMEGLSAEDWAVICDTYYIYFLPSSYMKLEKKQRDIRWAAEKGGLIIPPDNSEIWSAQKGGFTRTGQRYHQKFRQFWFILLFAFKIKQKENIEVIINDANELQNLFDSILDDIDIASERAYDMRHAMLYLTFPEIYERIISTRDKNKIIEKFRNKVNNSIPLDIDKAILKIRESLSNEYDKSDRVFDFYQDLKDKWKTSEIPPGIVTTSEDMGILTIPEKEESQDINSSSVEINAHTEIQWMLLRLGTDMGLKVWVARNDKNKEINGHRFSELPSLISSLPTQFDDVTTKTIELIDVLWLKGNAIVAAFEIESTTSIYSGLLRMSDLLSMQPNLNIPLYIVAPDERRIKVISEVNRPTFSRLYPPLNQICGYIPFSTLRQFVGNIGAMVRYLKPEFLDEISESCEIEEES